MFFMLCNISSIEIQSNNYVCLDSDDCNASKFRTKDATDMRQSHIARYSKASFYAIITEITKDILLNPKQQ